VDQIIGIDFPSIEKRVLSNYRAVFAKVHAVEDLPCSESAQTEFASFLDGIISSIIENPGLIGFESTPDGYLSNNALNKSNPELIDRMKKIEKKIDKVYENLFDIGTLGAVRDGTMCVAKSGKKFTKKTLGLFESLGLLSNVTHDETCFHAGKYPSMIPAWKYLAEVVAEIDDKRKRLLCFRTARFDDDDTARSISIFDRLLEGNGSYETIKSRLEAVGFLPSGGTGHDVTLSLQKRIDSSKSDEWTSDSSKGSWGISLEFDKRFKDQIKLTVRLPKYKEVLVRFDALEDPVKKMIVERTKHCNNCGYCTQTDKTGKRKPLTVPISYEGKRYGLCPLYPEWGFRSFYMDESTEILVNTMMDAVDPIYTALQNG
jgi:hypothetical protein